MSVETGSPTVAGVQRETLYPRPLDFPTFEFRLLTLLQPRVDEAASGIIRCTLRHDFLIERYDEKTWNNIPIPEYIALSYCWGDPSDTRQIIINDIRTEVTTNLEAALRALRDLKIEVLWIDALCINQRDLLERGLQVMRMGLIYSNATKVIAWIGEEADNSQMALGYLHDAAQKAIRPRFPGVITSYKKPPLADYFAEPILALFRRPYWKRVWVIQEISKGRVVFILCGSQFMEWNFLQAAIQHLGVKIHQEVLALRYFREGERNKKRPTLHRALSESKRFLATDSRDKIYGILGLTSDGSDFVPAPNYLQPAASVYFQLLKGFLSEQEEFSYLFRAPPLQDEDVRLSLTHVEPDWTTLELGISCWLLLVFDKQRRRAGRTEVIVRSSVHGAFSTFSSLPLNYPIFPRETRNIISHPPFVLRNGLHTSVYIIDVIESTATSFPVTDGVDLSPAAPRLSVHSIPTKDERLQLVQQQMKQPSRVLKSLCQALFSAYVLSAEVEAMKRINDFKDTLLADIMARMMNLPTTRRAVQNRFFPLYHPFPRWLHENEDLYFHGRTLGTWLQMHAAPARVREDREEDKGKIARILANVKDEVEYWVTSHDEWFKRSRERRRRVVNATNALNDAVTTAAFAGLKIAIGMSTQIPGLVPVNAQRGDLIALMPDSNLPVILRSVDGCTAQFIGESSIYIFGPPLDQFSTTRQSFGDDWGLHEDWRGGQDVWFPTEFKNEDRWQQMRII